MDFMEWHRAIQDFLNELRHHRGASENTILAYQNDLSQLASFLGGYLGPGERWQEVNGAVLNAYVQSWLAQQRYTSSTLARKIAALRTFFRWLLQRGEISEDPSLQLRSPRVERRLPRVLDESEVQHLFAVIARSPSFRSLRDRALLEVIYAAGLRVSEAVGLRLRDVDLEKGVVLCSGRPGRVRSVPLTHAAVAAVRDYLRHRNEVASIEPDAYLFVNSRGNKLTRQSVWQTIRHYGREAGLGDDLTPHTLRHSRAAHLLERGMDIRTVREWLGHANLATTYLYRQFYSQARNGALVSDSVLDSRASLPPLAVSA